MKTTNQRFGWWFLTENLDNKYLIGNIGDTDYKNSEKN